MNHRTAVLALLVVLQLVHATPGDWVQSTKRRWLQQVRGPTNKSARAFGTRRTTSTASSLDDDDDDVELTRKLSLATSDLLPSNASSKKLVESDILEARKNATSVGSAARSIASSTDRGESTALSSSSEQQQHAPTISGLAGGALTALLQNPRAIAKWSLTGVQVGLALLLGQAIWQAAREVLLEFEDASGGAGGSSVLKPQAIAKVLEALEQQSQPPMDHLALYRITHQLQTVTGWQLFDKQQEGEQVKPSLERFLLSLTRHEYTILDQCLHMTSTQPNTSAQALWNNIHGIPDIQQAVMDRLHATRICMVHNPYASLFRDAGNNNGILLYGPPGCGKSMLLQAICAAIHMPCLVLTPSVLLKKYVGETNQLIRSLFQLTHKLGNCVVVLDELDGLFRERRQDEHDSSRELKTEFLQWWDGLQNTQSQNSRILFVGATNRPFDVDVAILRRMSQSHFIGLPMGPARMVLLQKLLQRVPHATDINIMELVQSTEGFSPSDLTQLVRTAAQQGPLRDGRGNHSNFRALQQQDLLNARQQMGPTPLSPNYRNALIQFHQQQRNQQQQAPQQQQQSGSLVPHQQHQQQPQVGVQSTPFGNFFHAGTVSLEDYDQDNDEASFTRGDFEDDEQEEVDDDDQEYWGESEDQYNNEEDDVDASDEEL
jgi:ATP-dependent 26S proteasome regulatory subunit